MASAAYYKKKQAQQHLAINEVQAITETLVATVARSRPRSPLRALLQALDRMEVEEMEATSEVANSAPPLVTPVLVLFSGPRGSGKSVQASHIAATFGGVHCNVSSLVRDALNGGRLPGAKDAYVPPPLQAEVRAVKESLVLRTPSLPPGLAARLILNRMQYETGQRRAAADAALAAGAQCPPSTVFFVLDGHPSTIGEALALEAATGQEISLVVSLHCSAECLQARRRSPASSAHLASLSIFEDYWSAQHKLRVVDGSQSITAVTRQVLTILQEE